MKIILADDVRGLGHRGDTVTVKPGYARNFLFPQGVAYEATKANVQKLSELKKNYDEKTLREKGVASEVASKVEGLTIVIAKKAGESVPAEKRPFAQDPELASEAGKKGGQESGGNFKNDPERAAEAGRKSHNG